MYKKELTIKAPEGKCIDETALENGEVKFIDCPTYFLEGNKYYFVSDISGAYWVFKSSTLEVGKFQEQKYWQTTIGVTLVSNNYITEKSTIIYKDNSRSYRAATPSEINWCESCIKHKCILPLNKVFNAGDYIVALENNICYKVENSDLKFSYDKVRLATETEIKDYDTVGKPYNVDYSVRGFSVGDYFVVVNSLDEKAIDRCYKVSGIDKSRGLIRYSDDHSFSILTEVRPATQDEINIWNVQCSASLLSFNTKHLPKSESIKVKDCSLEIGECYVTSDNEVEIFLFRNHNSTGKYFATEDKWMAKTRDIVGIDIPNKGIIKGESLCYEKKCINRTYRKASEIEKLWMEECINRMEFISLQKFIAEYPNCSKPQLPKSWEEYGHIQNHYFLQESGCIARVKSKLVNSTEIAANGVLPSEDLVNANIALCKLICLRDKYNDGWKADWSYNKEYKYLIYIENGKIATERALVIQRILHFKTSELRDLFISNFKDLIIKAKELL